MKRYKSVHAMSKHYNFLSRKGPCKKLKAIIANLTLLFLLRYVPKGFYILRNAKAVCDNRKSINFQIIFVQVLDTGCYDTHILYS